MKEEILVKKQMCIAEQRDESTRKKKVCEIPWTKDLEDPVLR